MSAVGPRIAFVMKFPPWFKKPFPSYTWTCPPWDPLLPPNLPVPDQILEFKDDIGGLRPCVEIVQTSSALSEEEAG